MNTHDRCARISEDYVNSFCRKTLYENFESSYFLFLLLLLVRFSQHLSHVGGFFLETQPSCFYILEFQHRTGTRTRNEL